MNRLRLRTEASVCLDCREPIYFSGCDAPTCDGYACPDCGTGCDLDFVDDDESVCAAEIADMVEEDDE